MRAVRRATRASTGMLAGGFLAWSLAVGLLTTLGGAIRLWHLDQHRVWFDEAFTAVAAMRSVQHLWLEFPKVEAHPPLFFILEHWITGWLGLGPAALRLLPAMLGTALIPLAALVLRRWLGDIPSLVATVGLALNPTLVWHSQDARMYTLLVLEMTCSIYLLDRAWGSQRPSRQRLWLIAALLVELMALFTHYLAVVLLPVELGILGVMPHYRVRLLKRWLFGQMAVLAIWAPWVLYWGAVPSAAHRPGPGMELWQPVLSLARLVSVGRAMDDAIFPLSWPDAITIALATIAWTSIITHWKARASCRPIAVWAAAGVVTFLALGWTTGRIVAIGYLPAAPAVVGLLAAPLVTWSRYRWPGAALLLLWFVVTGAVGISTYFDPSRYQKYYEYDSAAQTVAQLVGPNDLLVDTDYDPTFRYYAGLPSTYASILLPHAQGLQEEVLWSERKAELRGRAGVQNWGPDTEHLAADLEALAEEYDSFWLVIKPSTRWWDFGYAVQREMRRRFWPFRSVRAGDAELTQFVTARGLSRMHPLEPVAVFPAAQLLGVTCAIQSDGNGQVALAWLPLARTGTPLTVFVHGLVRGRLATQHDGWPAADAAVTTVWPVGRPLVDVHPVPRLGDVEELAIGLYDAATMVRERVKRGTQETDMVRLPLPCR